QYAAASPSHWVFRALNHLAWTTEIAIAVLAVIPIARPLAGLLLVISFAFIATQIRLGWLCEMVMVAGLLYVGPSDVIGITIAQYAPSWLLTSVHATAANVESLEAVFGAALVGYLLLLPLAHAGLFVNFYGRRTLPPLAQRALERYTNA